MVVLLGMERDERLAERGRVAGVEGGVPLLVLVAEAHDDDVGPLISVRVRIALTPAPRWSFQNGLLLRPRIATPQSSLAAWSVTGALNATSSPACRGARSMRSRQSVWISPER